MFINSYGSETFQHFSQRIVLPDKGLIISIQSHLRLRVNMDINEGVSLKSSTIQNLKKILFPLSIVNPATKKKEQTATLSCIYDFVKTRFTIMSSGQYHRF